MVAGDRRKIFAGRYAYLKPLGKGAGGAVYLCEDIQAGGREVAVKVLSAEAFATVQGKMIKREFEILSKLDHPNLVRVYDYGAMPDGGVFLAEEYIDGFSLQDARALIPPEGLIDITLQLLHALSYLHGMGMIHRDIKPANVMLLWLDDANARPMVKLVDFGLSSADPTRDTLRGGTRSYMAPEIIRGDKGELRSDLYSLGVTLYYAMCGVLPFGPRTKEDPPTSEEDFRPPEPHRLNPEVPLNLSRFTMVLLRQLPGFEYMDAGEALQSLAADSDSIDLNAAGQLANNLDVAAPPVLRGYFERGIVEDEPLLQETLVDKILAERTGRLRIIRGGPGVGKSRLLREIGAALKIAGLQVISLSCRPGMLRHALVLDMLSALVDVVDSRGLSVGERLRPNISLLRRLSTWLGDSANRGETNLRWMNQAFGDLQVLLNPERVVFLIEDAHWADSESLAFLEKEFNDSRPSIPGVVMTANAASPADVLYNCANTEVTECEGLSSEDVRYFFESRLGVAGIPQEWLERVTTYSRGNPSYVEELTRHLIDSGLLKRRSSIQWSLNVSDLLSFPLPKTKSESFRRRLNAFGHVGREYLEILALSDGPVEWSVLRKLVASVEQKDPEEIDRNIEMLRWRQFISIDLNTQGRRLKLIDEDLRDVLTGPMSPEWKRALHRRIAERVHKEFCRGQGSSAEVARQMDLGGHEKAQMWLEIAGHTAALDDLKMAAKLYQRSLEVASGPALVELNLRLAEVSQRLTDTRSAVEYLDFAWTAAERSSREILMYQVTLAGLRLSWSLGQISQANHWLARIDDLMPTFGQQPWTQFWRARLKVAEGKVGEAERELNKALTRFEYYGCHAGVVHVSALLSRVSSWLSKDTDHAFISAVVESGRDAGVDAAYAAALLGYGISLRARRKFDAATRAFSECFEVATRVGGPDLCAEALIELGLTHQENGELDKAMDRMREAQWLAAAVEHNAWSDLAQISLMSVQTKRGQRPDAAEISQIEERLADAAFPFWYEGTRRAIAIYEVIEPARAAALQTTLTSRLAELS